MNDIKVPKEIGFDYIPKDDKLCTRCIHYEICPIEWSCRTLNIMLEHYGQDFWSYIKEKDEE